ncbi:phosphodiester glycosidase family protein [Paenibacillus amylolyticus]|uniref:phosphodiester glycosidase family protein n=1 Tax=Paenibacillus amylolyticus TaxID=1451 RepID=UPI0033916FAE
MAINYEYKQVEGVPLSIFSPNGPRMKYIKTKLSNIKSETILKPMSQTSFMGINGGFFLPENDNYNIPPLVGRSIAYSATDSGNVSVTYGSPVKTRTLPKNYLQNGSSAELFARKTLVIYTSGGTTKAAYMYATNTAEVFAKYSNVKTIIGGNSFTSSDWKVAQYNVPLPRTAIAWRGDDVYLIVTPDAISIPDLRDSIAHIGLDPTNAIVLDGSGSSAIRVQTNGSWSNSFIGGNRYIYNMVRLINAT